MARQTMIALFWRAFLATFDDTLASARNLIGRMRHDERAILPPALAESARCAFHLLDRATALLEHPGHRPGPPQARPASELTRARSGAATAANS